VLFADVVNRADVGMVQRGSGLSLAPETLQRLCGLWATSSGRNLRATKRPSFRRCGVLGFVDDAHPAAAELLDDAVVRVAGWFGRAFIRLNTRFSWNCSGGLTICQTNGLLCIACLVGQLSIRRGLYFFSWIISPLTSTIISVKRELQPAATRRDRYLMSSSLEIAFSGRKRTKRFSPRSGVTLRRGGTLLQSMFTCARLLAIARVHSLLKSRRDHLLVLAALRGRFLGRGGSGNRR
jgi:hypothetical protein